MFKEKFIIRANNIHNNKYEYSLLEENFKNVDYINIICPLHGKFSQLAKNHLKGRGCRKCGRTEKLDNNEFIEKANKTHNNLYDYSLVEYISSHKEVKIICKNHGVFKQKPYKHLSGQGCSICKNSKGEEKIRIYLENNNILYEKEKTLDNCKNKRKLRFDFYLPDYNILIEYDGKQHFNSMDNFGGKVELKERIYNDEIKNNFCLDNNIELIRISYENFDNIEDILNEKINNNRIY